MRLTSWTLALAVLTPAVAAAANPYLESAQTAVRELRYADAIPLLEAASQVPSTDRRETEAILLLLAQCQVAEGKRTQAGKAFSTLLAGNPHYEIDPKLSPKIVDAFAAAKKSMFAPDHVRLMPRPSPGRAPRFALEDPWRQVGSVVMRSREGTGAWHETSGKRSDELVLFDDAPATHAEYYVVALSAGGATLASVGSAQAPVSFGPSLAASAAAPALQPVASPRSRVPAWVALGVGIAAAGVGVCFQVLAVDSGNRARNPDEWVDAAREHHARATREATAGTVLLAGAGAAAATAGILFVW